MPDDRGVSDGIEVISRGYRNQLLLGLRLAHAGHGRAIYQFFLLGPGVEALDVALLRIGLRLALPVGDRLSVLVEGRALNGDGPVAELVVAQHLGAVGVRVGEVGVKLYDLLAVLIAAAAAATTSPDNLAPVLALYQELAAAHPGDARLHGGHADTLHQAGQPEEALAAWNRALTADGEDPSLHFNRGQLLFELNRIDEASEDMLAVTRLRPGDILGAAVLLAAITWPADQDQARQHLQTALASPGTSLTPYARAFYQAIALTGLGRADDATALLQAAAQHLTASETMLDAGDRLLLDAFSEPPMPGLDTLRAYLEPRPEDPPADDGDGT